MDNELLLSSKNDIPFPEAQISIHQPTCNEIALMGEEAFWSGCRFLNFSKSLVSNGGKFDLTDITDFEIFMSIMASSEKADYIDNAKTVLMLLFPEAEITYNQSEIMLLHSGGISRIDQFNFDIFKDIVVSMFKLEDMMGAAGGTYNPEGDKARKIAEKLQKAKNRKSSQEKSKTKITFLNRYISILSVGEQKDKNDLMNYTVSQLKDEFTRYQMKQSFDMYMQAKMAGAQDVEEVENWMSEIHSNN